MRQTRGFFWVPMIGLCGLATACGGTAFTNAASTDGGANEAGSSGGPSSSSSGGLSSSGAGSSGSSGGASSGSGNSSGSSGSSGGSTSGSSSGSSGSSSGGSSSGCPTSIPADGSPCSISGLECEYGLNPVLGCNRLATCSSSQWQIQGPVLNDCTIPSGGSCPSSYGAVPQGTTCTPTNLICNYLEGRCECSTGPIIRVVDSGTVGTWYCQGSSAAGCPGHRPPLGSTCTSPGLFCNYGSCYIEGGSSQTCTGGIWVRTPTACPA